MPFNTFDALIKLLACFPQGRINGQGEFIPFRDMPDIWFNLAACGSERDVKVKVLAWLSRAAAKECLRFGQRKNRVFPVMVRECINAYLGSSFSQSDMELIYHRLGNGINRELVERFIDAGYPMDMLEGVEQ